MNNLARVFHDIVSVDGWRSRFGKDGVANVHIDLSFMTGRMGSSEGRKVSFTLSLRSARLKIVVPKTEPMAVIQSSVDREGTMEGIKRVLEETDLSTLGSVAGSVQLGQRPQLSMGANANLSAKTKFSEQIEKSVWVSDFDIRQVIDGQRNYCWDIKHTKGKPLAGKVWDPNKRPAFPSKQILLTRKLSPHAMQ